MSVRNNKKQIKLGVCVVVPSSGRTQLQYMAIATLAYPA